MDVAVADTIVQWVPFVFKSNFFSFVFQMGVQVAIWLLFVDDVSTHFIYVGHRHKHTHTHFHSHSTTFEYEIEGKKSKLLQLREQKKWLFVKYALIYFINCGRVMYVPLTTVNTEFIKYTIRNRWNVQNWVKWTGRNSERTITIVCI